MCFITDSTFKVCYHVQGMREWHTTPTCILSISSHVLPLEYLHQQSGKAMKHMLVRIDPHYACSPLHQDNGIPTDDIVLLFRLFSLLAPKSAIDPLRSKGQYPLKFRALLRQNWLQTIHEIEELRLERGHFGREILRNWKDLRSQLNIRRIKQSSDPNHSVPWGVSCHWRDCLCTKWSHTAFRVCKGCWGPFYCNAMCQKL